MFLKGLVGAGAVSIASYAGLFSLPAFAEQAKKQEKHCILLWLTGAPSQFETWDPKPGTLSGGPFRAIGTNLPGVQISSLMPRCATIMDKLKRRFGNDFVGWDVTNDVWTVTYKLRDFLWKALGHLDDKIIDRPIRTSGNFIEEIGRASCRERV